MVGSRGYLLNTSLLCEVADLGVVSSVIDGPENPHSGPSQKSS
jgi:hypothetical protein